MKELTKKNKIVLCILILFILAGIIILVTAGFRKSTLYTAGSRIEVYLPQGYQKEEIINIAQECFPNQKIEFEEIEKLEQVASIRLKNYTAEELENYKTKIAEKYEIDKESLEIEEVKLPKIKISTVIKPYVVPLLLISFLTLVYTFLRNLKSENKWKIVLRILISLIVTLGLYFSVLVIIRIPFGSYTMPVALAIYLITIMLCFKKKE